MLNSRLMLGFPNRIDMATLSGGSWRANLHLVNLQSRLFSRVARSTNATASSTQFTIDFGRPEKIQVFAMIAHSISLTGRLRITAARDSGFTDLVYGPMTRDVWGGLITAPWDINELEWEEDRFWIGGFSNEDIEGITATSAHVFDMPYTARYWKFEIIDEANPNGYIDIGRIFIGPALQPRSNFSMGAGEGYENLTSVVTSLGGAEFFDPRESTRVFRFTLEYLDDAEGYGRFNELIRKAGVSGEVFVIPDPSDDFYGLLRNFLGRPRQMSLLEHTAWVNDAPSHSVTFEFKELR